MRLLAALVVLLLTGCDSEGCLDAEPGEACTVPSPCQKLAYACDGGTSSIRVLGPDEALPPGQATLASDGDFILENDRVTVVIDALAHPHFIAPSGGSILDFAPVGGGDRLNNVFQGVGLLPNDAVEYTDARIIDDGPVKAVQLRGHFYARPKLRVATRYEIRPCEPGIRVRTEAVNLERDPQVWSLLDGYFWGDKQSLPFVPLAGQGFRHPDFGLTTVDDVFADAAFLVAADQSTVGTSYATVACNADSVSGFQSNTASSAGRARRVVPPRDYEIYERFIGAAPGGAASHAADLALELRQKLFDEPWAELSGRVIASGPGDLQAPARAAVIVSEGSLLSRDEKLVPWTQASLDADGRFRVRVPAKRRYVVDAQAFGVSVARLEVEAGKGAVDVGTLEMPPVAALDLGVTLDGVAGDAQVFVHPADEETRDAVTAQLMGQFTRCAPLLGAPHGGSPACNRILVSEPTRVAVPPGTYDLFATAGPFVSLAHDRVSVVGGDVINVDLALSRLPLRPAGVLSADFHVHGAPSFDSSIPDLDRVRAFLAAGVDVIAATEHDVVYDYASAIQALGASSRLALIPGVETTGHILFDFVPDSPFPHVIGHWNFWPMAYDPRGPYRGAPWDERAEPGTLFTRMVDAGFDRDAGVVQLNHPWFAAELGRDLGFPRAIGLDLTQPPTTHDDGTAQSLLNRTPKGARYANDAYDTQEVMNGSDNAYFVAYRAFWFYLLNHGIVRAGTANSDSHGLSDNVLGTPRNLVWTDSSVAAFDVRAFNHAVKAGHLIGTNGPILEAWIDADTRPGTQLVTPAGDAILHVRVRAAPWVPVAQARVVVNGHVVRVLDGLTSVADPFGTTDLDRLDVTLPLADLLPASGDAWLVVEAGAPLAENRDLDCNGVPDTGDNDGNRTIDWRDVDRDEDGDVDALDLEGGKSARCLDETGPLAEPPTPERDTPGYPFAAVTPHGYPLSFTNPFLLDRNGDGAFQPVSAP